jgi:hypothetical protein
VHVICASSAAPVLCGCETWSLILRDEHRLRVFENKKLRRISGTEWQKITMELSKLQEY